MSIPIRSEAVEAAAKAICESDLDPNPKRELEERWDAYEDDSPTRVEYRANARAAISEFCRVEGLKVETGGERPAGVMFPPKLYQRLVGEWHDVKEEHKP
jgi:hypothetical protein